MIGFAILHIFVSAGMLWILLRFLAKDEADLAPSRYPIFGAVYWLVMWFLSSGMQWGYWTLIPLTLMTAYALYQFFFVTLVKSLWLALLFVVIRTVIQIAAFVAMNELSRTVQS